jgi:hypothetical protein
MLPDAETRVETVIDAFKNLKAKQEQADAE